MSSVEGNSHQVCRTQLILIGELCLKNLHQEKSNGTKDAVVLFDEGKQDPSRSEEERPIEFH